MFRMSNLSVVGKPLKRINGPEILSGKAQFSIDVIRPNMLYGRILYSPYPHAEIIDIDTSKAEALPGVKAVVTYEDAPPRPIPSMPSDMLVLDKKVRFVGDEVAAVAATNPYVAEEALDLIEVTYRKLTPVFTIEEALKPGAPEIHEGGNVVKEQSGEIIIGDPEKALKNSDHIFEVDVSTPRFPIAPINPQVAVAEWSADGSLTVWDSNQVIYDRLRELAFTFDLPMSKVKVISEYCGCGFGEDNKFRYPAIAALLAKKAKRPVKLEPGKSYQFRGSTKMRHATKGHVKLGINNDGTITAIDVDSLWDKGAYAAGGVSVSAVGGGATLGLYRVPNLRYAYKAVYTNNPPCGAFRGYGDPQGHCMVESAVNMAAEELGIDPVLIRRKNHVQVGDLCLSEAVFGLGTLTSTGLDDCLSLGAQKIDWATKWKPFKAKSETGTLRRGVGMMAWVHTSGEIREDSSATVMMYPDGTAAVMTSLSEMGTGVTTTMAQIAAEELGIRYEDVRMVFGNSELPEAAGQYASKSAHVTGEAVRRAAADVKRQLFEIAAPMLGVEPSELDAKDGKIYVVTDPSKSVRISDVMKNPAVVRSIVGKGKIRPPEGDRHAMIFGADFIEVEVNTETGNVEVIQMVLAHDVGKAINPMIVEGQIKGGACQGLGEALAEDYIIDSDGVTLSDNYLNYGLISMADWPKADVIIVEPVDPLGPFGAKGVGEPGIIPFMAMVRHAIYNAIGKWLDPPFTPAKVLKALGKV
jgi:xanthine dehydrogenase molybdenum-binding subunit